MYVPPLLPFFIIFFLIGIDALRDGKLQSLARSATILRRLGARPVFDPANNPRHRDVAKELSRDNTPAWRVRLEELELALTDLPGLAKLLAAELFLVIVEWLGDVQLLKMAGFNDFRRNLIALALVAAFFVAAEIIDRLAQRQTWVFWVAILLATLVVFCITIVQLQSITGDDASTLADIGLAAILALSVVGPAALSALVNRNLHILVPLLAKRALLRHWIRKDERRQQRARRQLHQLGRWQEWWDRCVSRLEAQYNYKFRRTFLKRGTPADLQQLLAVEPSLVPDIEPPHSDASTEETSIEVAVALVQNPYQQHGGNGREQ